MVRPPRPQRRSARLRARAANRVLPEDTASIVAQAREAYERARPFAFPRLPGEIRNLVYEFLVADQNAAAGPQALHARGAAAVALPGLARASRALRAEYLAVFFRRRAFEAHVYCDLAAWRSLHRVALVASFLGSLDAAVRALPDAALALARARYYGCVKEPAAPLSRLWAELHAPRPADADNGVPLAARVRQAARAAAGPRLAHLVLLVGVFPDEPTGALSHTPAAKDFWSATLAREPVTGKLLLEPHDRPGSAKYENELFVKLARNARKTATDIVNAQGGTFQGWSVPDILDICGHFRFWRNHRCPKEFADEDYDYDEEDDDNVDDRVANTN